MRLALSMSAVRKVLPTKHLGLTPGQVSAFKTGVLSRRVVWAGGGQDPCGGMEMLLPEPGSQAAAVCEAAQQSHAEHNGDCLFIPAEEKGTYLF